VPHLRLVVEAMAAHAFEGYDGTCAARGWLTAQATCPIRSNQIALQPVSNLRANWGRIQKML